MAIVTTKAVKNDLIIRGAQPLKHVTTRDIKVEYIDKEPPFQAPTSKPVTTRDYKDVAERNKRAQVMAEKEAFEMKKAEEGLMAVEFEVTTGVSEDESFPEDILIGTLNDELVGLYDPDWKKEPVWSTKKKK